MSAPVIAGVPTDCLKPSDLLWASLLDKPSLFPPSAHSHGSGDLPGNIAFKDQANTFTANQTVTGTITASGFASALKYQFATATVYGAASIERMAVNDYDPNYGIKIQLGTSSKITFSADYPTGYWYGTEAKPRWGFRQYGTNEIGHGLVFSNAGVDVSLSGDYSANLNVRNSAGAFTGVNAGNISAAKYYLGSLDYFDCVSGGSSRWSTPYAGRFIFSQRQNAQSMQLALQTAEGKFGSITHYDVNNAKGRLLEIGADPAVAISIAPFNDELARFTSWSATRQIELKAPVIVSGNITANGSLGTGLFFNNTNAPGRANFRLVAGTPGNNNSFGLIENYDAIDYVHISSHARSLKLGGYETSPSIAAVTMLNTYGKDQVVRADAYATSDKIYVAKGVASQTGNYFEAQTSSGTVEFSVAPGGVVTASGTFSSPQNSTGERFGVGTTAQYAGVAIGYGASAGWSGIAIGFQASTASSYAQGGIAIGYSSYSVENAVALGPRVYNTVANTCKIGDSLVPLSLVVPYGGLTASGTIESASALGMTSPGLGTANWWRMRADNGTACVIYSNNSGKGMTIENTAGLVTVESLTSLGNITASGVTLNSASTGTAPLIVNGTGGQANLQQWKNHTDTIVAQLSNGGLLWAERLGITSDGNFAMSRSGNALLLDTWDRYEFRMGNGAGPTVIDNYGNINASGDLTLPDGQRFRSASNSIRLGNYPEIVVTDTFQIQGSEQRIIFGGSGAYALIESTVPINFTTMNGITPQGITANDITVGAASNVKLWADGNGAVVSQTTGGAVALKVLSGWGVYFDNSLTVHLASATAGDGAVRITTAGDITAKGDLILDSRSSGNVTKYVKAAAPTSSGYGNHLVIQASSANTSGQGGSVYLIPGTGAGGPGAGTIYLGTASSWVGASVSGPLTVTNNGPNTGTALNIIAGGSTGLAIYWDNLTPFMQYSLAEGRQSRFVNSSSYTFDASVQAAANSTMGGLIATDGTTTIQMRVGWGGNYEDSGQIWHNGTPRQIFSSDGVATVGNLMIVGDYLVRPIDHGNSYMRFTGTGRRITEIVGWDEIRLGINGATDNLDITATGTTIAGNITATGYVTSAIQSLSTDPTGSDLASGQTRTIKNTSTGTTKVWLNDGGAFKSLTFV